jgi:hypothetical protein
VRGAWDVSSFDRSHGGKNDLLMAVQCFIRKTATGAAVAPKRFNYPFYYTTGLQCSILLPLADISNRTFFFLACEEWDLLHSDLEDRTVLIGLSCPGPSLPAPLKHWLAVVGGFAIRFSQYSLWGISYAYNPTDKLSM